MRFALPILTALLTGLGTAASIMDARNVCKLGLLSGVQIGAAAVMAYPTDHASLFAAAHGRDAPDADTNVTMVPGLKELKEIEAREKYNGEGDPNSNTVQHNLWQCRVCAKGGHCNPCQNTCALRVEAPVAGHKQDKKDGKKPQVHEEQGMCGKGENDAPPGKCQLCVTTKSGTYCASCKSQCKATLIDKKKKKQKKGGKRDGGAQGGGGKGYGQGMGQGSGKGHGGGAKPGEDEPDHELECK